jgi:hypothetical protein
MVYEYDNLRLLKTDSNYSRIVANADLYDIIEDAVIADYMGGSTFQFRLCFLSPERRVFVLSESQSASYRQHSYLYLLQPRCLLLLLSIFSVCSFE